MQREKFYASLNQVPLAVWEESSGLSEEGIMGEMAFQARLRRRGRALWLGLTLSAIVAHLGHAQVQIMQPFSAMNNGVNPLALPGQDLTQQKMGQSINVFCPTVSSIASPTPG